VEHCRRVLIVEDDGAIRSLIKFLVERERWSADAVSDGEEALRRILNGHYDAIVLDLMLPGVLGVAILDEVRRSAPSALSTIVVVTASPALVKKLDTTGIGAILIKPFDIDELIQAVRRCAAA
jgi:DNA-binding response OmpR family regulator